MLARMIGQLDSADRPEQRDRSSSRRRLPATKKLPLLALLVGALLLVMAASMAFFPTRAEATDRTPGSETPSSTVVGRPVWVTQVKGVISPPLAGYLIDTIEKAAEAEAAALVIEMDTPGGLDSSMRDIIQAIIDSPIAVVIYVHPQGARAASAGLYILMASDVAAMAPQTNVGAATPVSLGEEMDETMQAKVTNDAAAYIRTLASNHGRNADWAEKAVREAASLPAEEALEQDVIEFLAPDLPSLLQAINGYVTTPKGLVLETAGAPVKEVRMGWIRRFLHAIASPDVAYILMTIGILGIIMELSSPGIGVAGVAGVISLLLSFYAFQVLPVNLVGIALIVLAMILFIAELKVQSHGILGVGGAASLIAGGLLLFDSSEPYLRVSWPALVGVALVVVVFFTFVIQAVARVLRRRPAVGTEALIGVVAVALTPLDPEGQVRLEGEVWRARAKGAFIAKGERVQVVDTQGLTVIVEPVKSPSAPTPDEGSVRPT